LASDVRTALAGGDCLGTGHFVEQAARRKGADAMGGRGCARAVWAMGVDRKNPSAVPWRGNNEERWVIIEVVAYEAKLAELAVRHVKKDIEIIDLDDSERSGDHYRRRLAAAPTCPDEGYGRL
jgi:hypothetical protein